MAAQDRDTPINPHLAASVTEIHADRKNGRDPREDDEPVDEAMKRAVEAVPLGRRPEEYARMAAIHSYRSADNAAAAFELAGKAFGDAGRAYETAQKTHGYLLQLVDQNPSIAARVTRTMSGSMKAVLAQQPSLPPVQIPENASKSGVHYTIPMEKLEKLEREIRDREAAEKGAKEALAQLAVRAEEQRKRLAFWLAVVVAAAGGIGWASAHLPLVAPTVAPATSH
jgi:hypothetical protein